MGKFDIGDRVIFTRRTSASELVDFGTVTMCEEDGREEWCLVEFDEGWKRILKANVLKKSKRKESAKQQEPFVLLTEVRNLVGKELMDANKEYPPFASRHEGYAVILEEMDECKEALEKAESETRLMWDYIKTDKPSRELEIWRTGIEMAAIRLAAEAIQVAAMARKFAVLLEQEGENKHGKSMARKGTEKDTGKAREKVCKWRLENGTRGYRTECGHYSNPRYKYCQYCGGRIEVAGDD